MFIDKNSFIHRAFISNQKGASFLMATLVTATFSGAFLYVQSHFDTKMKELEEGMAKENILNLKREVDLVLSNPKLCEVNFGANYKVNPQTIKTAYTPPPPPSGEPEQHHNPGSSFEDTKDLFLVNSGGQPLTNRPFVNYPNIKIRDIQLVIPGTIASVTQQWIPASIFITPAKYNKNSYSRDYPPIEKKLILNLSRLGSEYEVKKCIPEKPPEMLTYNSVYFKHSKRGSFDLFIEKEERSTFKLCAISGYENKPDINNLDLLRFSKGDIAGVSLTQCRVYPVDDALAEMNPRNITHPVRWKLASAKNDDMDFLNLITVQVFESSITCEAVCF